MNEPVARFAIANNGVRLVACGGAGAVRRRYYGALLAQQRLEIGAQQQARLGIALVLVIGLEDAALLLQLREELAATAYHRKEDKLRSVGLYALEVTVK